MVRLARSVRREKWGPWVSVASRVTGVREVRRVLPVPMVHLVPRGPAVLAANAVPWGLKAELDSRDLREARANMVTPEHLVRLEMWGPGVLRVSAERRVQWGQWAHWVPVVNVVLLVTPVRMVQPVNAGRRVRWAKWALSV